MKKQKSNAADDVWLERQDPRTGRLYYYNPKRRETAWHRPDQLISTGALQADDAGGAWVERQDPRTGRPYFYNPILGKTSWVNPEAEDQQQRPTEKKESALKRLSVNMASALNNVGNRLSLGALSAGSAGNRISRASLRNSARFSMNTPALPVNKSTPRTSMRLGGEGNADIFAALRAMQQQKPTTQVATQVQPADTDPLKIDIQRELSTVTEQSIRAGGTFNDYASLNFNTRRKGAFGSKEIPLETLKRHQRTVLKAPLHALNDKNLTSDALLAFKFILWYSGDKSTKKDTSMMAQEFCSLGMNTDQKLMDELFCQLVKQTRGNNDPGSRELVWELFALAAGCFQPSDELRPYVYSHIKDSLLPQDSAPASARVPKLAKYAYLRMERYGAPRLEPPSDQEVSALRAQELVPVNFVVNLISTSPLTVHVDSWTTVKSIREAVESRFQIHDGAPFALFEITGDEQERVLDDEDNLYDVIAYWERIGGDIKALYKIRLYFDINEEDTAAVELAYLQAVYEVIDQRYPCSQGDAIFLAALEAQEKHGDFVQNQDVLGTLGGYIPPKYFQEGTQEEMKRAIYQHYSSFQGYGKLQCMINYLNYVKQWKYYGSQYYYADPVQLKVMGKSFPKKVILGINAKGILVIDPPSLELIVEYPYSEVVTWGFSVANFVFVVGNLVRATKLFFKTSDGQEMNSLIHAYVHKLMEAQAAEKDQEERDVF